MKKRTVVTLIVLSLIILISMILAFYCYDIFKFVYLFFGGYYVGTKCNKLIDWICADNNEESEVETK